MYVILRHIKDSIKDLIKRGGILSEQPPGTPPVAWHFPARNRLISGLADVVLVMEAKEKSGSLITADMALEQGRDIYALPGMVTEPLSCGCNRLIRQGAGILLNEEDLLEELVIKGSLKKKIAIISDTKNKIKLETKENLVYSKLGLYPRGLDDLQRETGLTPQEVMGICVSLQLKGCIQERSKIIMSELNDLTLLIWRNIIYGTLSCDCRVTDKSEDHKEISRQAHYVVMASNGHVRDLPKSQMGVDLEHDFEPKYITIRGKGEILAGLRKRSKKADKIYLATDPDREGEAISWHLMKALKLEGKKVYRISFNEITKSAVKASLKNARDIDMDLVDAQQARRVLDRIVGYKISPVLWAKSKRGLSAGRVQSVALRIIADREDEIARLFRKNTGHWTPISR